MVVIIILGFDFDNKTGIEITKKGQCGHHMVTFYMYYTSGLCSRRTTLHS